MRTGPTFTAASILAPVNSVTTRTRKAFSSPPAMMQQRSPWHSPVPYLFGGLAAMLGLIAFALLILACSYWRLSGHLRSGDPQGDVEAAGNEKPEDAKTLPVFEEKIVVIMAGDVKPSFLATPTTGYRAKSSVGDVNGRRENTEREKVEEGEKSKAEMSHDRDQSTAADTENQ